MKYKPELVREMVKWVETNGLVDYGGATLKSFLHKFQIDDMTYYRWIKKTDFAEAIKKAKDVFKANLENDLVGSLSKAAKGYNAEYTRTEYVSDQNGKPIINKQIKESKPIPPNIAANIFLLTNIASDRWKNRQNQEVTGADGEPLSQTPITIQISETKPTKVEVER